MFRRDSSYDLCKALRYLSSLFTENICLWEPFKQQKLWYHRSQNWSILVSSLLLWCRNLTLGTYNSELLLMNKSAFGKLTLSWWCDECLSCKLNTSASISQEVLHLISSVNSVCKNAALSHLMTDIYYICCCLCDVSGDWKITPNYIFQNCML